MNALSIGGATFLGSAGLGSLSTHLKQKKGKRDVYEDYFDARSSGLGEESDWYQECIGPNCPQKHLLLLIMIGFGVINHLV